MKFAPYVCCGDPSLSFSFKLVKTLAPYSEFIEIGIPFSDPIADGKTIQAASTRALKNGVNVEKIFSMVEKLRAEGVKTPFSFMTYYNIVFSYGNKRFLQKMRAVGVQGLILPDLPLGEDLEFEKMAGENNIALIHLIAPNTPTARVKKILREENMFTYLVSVTGITGSRSNVSSSSIDFVKRVCAMAGGKNKLLVGFGVSSAQQAEEFVRAGASGVFVGSKIIELYNGRDEKTALADVKAFAQSFRE